MVEFDYCIFTTPLAFRFFLLHITPDFKTKIQVYIPTYSFDTNKGTLMLSSHGLIEPNNGRMLLEARLTLNGEDMTEFYFGKWNYINYIGQYEPLSDDKSWIYIPHEGDHFLINAQSLEKIPLPSLNLSAAYFIKNVFYQQFLVVLSYDTFICKNLSTGILNTMYLDDRQQYFKDIVSINPEVVCVSNNKGQVIEFILPA
jgi:hypothetical protein